MIDNDALIAKLKQIRQHAAMGAASLLLDPLDEVITELEEQEARTIVLTVEPGPPVLTPPAGFVLVDLNAWRAAASTCPYSAAFAFKDKLRDDPAAFLKVLSEILRDVSTGHEALRLGFNELECQRAAIRAFFGTGGAS